MSKLHAEVGKLLTPRSNYNKIRMLLPVSRGELSWGTYSKAVYLPGYHLGLHPHFTQVGLGLFL